MLSDEFSSEVITSSRSDSRTKNVKCLQEPWISLCMLFYKLRPVLQTFEIFAWSFFFFCGGGGGGGEVGLLLQLNSAILSSQKTSTCSRSMKLTLEKEVKYDQM